MAAARTRKSTSKRRPRSAPARRKSARRDWRSALPVFSLQEHHLDIIGLGLIAVGIFLAGVGYLHWSGGALGGGAIRGLRLLFGVLGYAVPAGLVVAGAVVLAREFRPPTRPMRTGIIVLVCAMALALAAGTLGVGPGAAAPGAFWRQATLQARGGALGQAELWVTGQLISTTGADILAVFLLLAGSILVSGATLAGRVASDRFRRA